MSESKKKDWREIAQIDNPRLRLRLITADGDERRTFQNVLPHCFKPADEPAVLPSKERVLGVLRGMRNMLAATRVLEDLELPALHIFYEGRCMGTTESLPIQNGGVDTADGWTPHFWRSELAIGDHVEYFGVMWVVAWTAYVPGHDGRPDVHDFLIVPIGALQTY